MVSLYKPCWYFRYRRESKRSPKSWLRNTVMLHSRFQL